MDLYREMEMALVVEIVMEMGIDMIVKMLTEQAMDARCQIEMGMQMLIHMVIPPPLDGLLLHMVMQEPIAIVVETNVLTTAGTIHAVLIGDIRRALVKAVNGTKDSRGLS